MKKLVLYFGVSLALAGFAAPALGAEPLTLLCKWQAERSTISDYDSTKKKGEKSEVTFLFDFDKGEVSMEGLAGTAKDLVATTNAINFCVDQCGRSASFERRTDDGPITATIDSGRVAINRLTGAITWARTETQMQGALAYNTISNAYVGTCEKTATLVPKF
jgi:hypothetical protein